MIDQVASKIRDAVVTARIWKLNQHSNAAVRFDVFDALRYVGMQFEARCAAANARLARTNRSVERILPGRVNQSGVRLTAAIHIAGRRALYLALFRMVVARVHRLGNTRTAFNADNPRGLCVIPILVHQPQIKAKCQILDPMSLRRAKGKRKQLFACISAQTI